MLSDGGMGTSLIERGVAVDACFETLNVAEPALVESVHRGMASGMLEHGRLLLGSEPLLAAFQEWVQERLASE